MDAEDLLQTMHRKEFRPVELHLCDGQKLLFPHPDYFLVFPSEIGLGLPGWDSF